MDRHMIFPNTTTIAMYNAYSQTIELSDIKRIRLNAIISNPMNIENIDDYSTLMHEVNNYFDNISTLRGLRLLASLYNAYNAIYKETQEEKNMWRIIYFNNSIRGMKFENYYKMVEKYACDSDYRNWSFSQSIGFRYNYEGHLDFSKPIIFNRYDYKDNFVARIPISIESLWENSSIAVELSLKLKVIASLSDQYEKVIEINSLNKRTLEWIYNTDMLVYSNIAHSVANSLVTDGDIYNTFMYTKKLASLSLNMPDKYFKSIKIPNFIKERLTSEDINSFIENKDISFLFICLLYNIKESGLVKSIDNIIDNDSILRCSYLPSEEMLISEIKEEMKNLSEEIIDGYYKEDFLTLWEKGILFFDKRGIFNDFDYSTLTVQEIGDLPIMCRDEIFVDSKILNWCDEVKLLELRMKEFIEACGY